MAKKKKGIDMGINSICNVCDRRYCICPERQADRSWVSKKPLAFELRLELTREKLADMGVFLISMTIGDTMTQPLVTPNKEIVNLIIERVREKKK